MKKSIDYSSLMNQIANLKKQAESVRSLEKSTAVAEIKEQMKTLGISLADLQIGGSSKVIAPKGVRATKSVKKEILVKATRRKPEAKYLDPTTGTTWTGRGKTPKWLQAALLSGKKKEKFAIR
jgi:DNA-binding protein H-NS